MARPILFGVLIIVAVYLPIFTLEGLEGKMFRPMAITVCSAILGSLLLSLTAVPVGASFLLKLGGGEHEGPWFERLRRFYTHHLAVQMNHRARTIGVSVIAVTIAIGSLPFIGTEFMPKLDEGSILIETRKLPSVSLPESVAISTHVETILRRFDEVKQIVTKIGRPDLGHRGHGHLPGGCLRDPPPLETWKSGRTKDDLIGAMSEALGALPGVEFNFTQPMAMRLDEVVSGVKADVAVKVFGPDAAVLERLGGEIQAVLSEVPGAADLQVEVLSGAAQLEIVADRARMARYGINVAHLRELVETAVGGAIATEILDGSRRFDVVVRFPDAMRGDPGGDRQPAADGARRRARAPRQRGERGDGAGPGGHQPRERRTAAGRPDERARPGRRQFRRRGAAAPRGPGDDCPRATTSRGAASSRTSSARCSASCWSSRCRWPSSSCCCSSRSATCGRPAWSS